MLKSRITNIIQKPNWNPPNSNETFYVFLINLENGDEGNIYKKTNNLKLEIGQEINYTLNEKRTIKINRDFKTMPSFMNYNIEEELRIRKILEELTPWNIELNQNYEDKYGYDLKFYKHIETKTDTGFKKELLGFIEVEACPPGGYSARAWTEHKFPDYLELSFLKRKVFKWDKTNNCWSKEPKEDYEKVIYLKVNPNYTNCYAINLKSLVNNHWISKRSDGTYNNTFMVTERKNVTFEFKNVVKLMREIEKNWEN